MTSPMQKTSLTLTAQEVADLRHLVSIAVWIRSEQLGAENVVMQIKAEGIDSVLPPVQLINEGFVVHLAMGDVNGGMHWWKRLTASLELLNSAQLRPSWSKE